MTMRIRLAKGSDGKPNVLTCFREDGTATWMPLGTFFPLHDLTHYAVETMLGYRDAFFGLVAKGWDIRDFTEKARDPITGGVVKSVLPAEALYAEFIVGTIDRVRGVLGLDADQPEAEALFYEMAAVTRDTSGVSFPEVTSEQLRAILRTRDALAERWAGLAPGDSLEMEF